MNHDTRVSTQFYLDKQNAKWLGVCSGLAAYSGVDVLWVRVATSRCSPSAAQAGSPYRAIS